ncbi:MAG: chemotaxis protein CheB [Actinomycetota bacterium]
MPEQGLAAPSGRAESGPTGRSDDLQVLIVDDSQVVRRLLSRVIEAAPGLAVAGQADDGRRGLELVRSIRPDVVVLDLEMPGMDGFQFLQAVADEHLAADVIVFANVEPVDRPRIGAKVRAAGAELIIKPTGVSDASEALARIEACLLGPLRQRHRRRARPANPLPGVRRVVNAIVIASSTGGPNALEVVLGNITKPRVPIFIVQHIADGFSGRLADRLDSVASFPVHEVSDGQRPEPGHAYVGPGGIHLTVERDEGGLVMRLRDLAPVNSCRPSADVLFQSSAEIYGGNQVGLVLTGIGRDGLDGCRVLAAKGAPIVVQDEATSVVWGMPGVVATDGLADEILPLDAIGPRLQHLAQAGAPNPRPRTAKP